MAGENTQEASDRISILQDEINRLDQHEKMLDQHKTVCGGIFISNTNVFMLYFVSVGAAKYQEYS